jgi:hypothetical protein
MYPMAEIIFEEIFSCENCEILEIKNNKDFIPSNHYIEKIKKFALKKLKILPKTNISKYYTERNFLSQIESIDYYMLTTIFTGTTITIISFLKYITPLLQEWLRNKGSRSVTIKANNTELKFKGTFSKKEFNEVIEIFQKVKSKRDKK